MVKGDKPMLDTWSQIRHLQSKGVRFIHITEDEAVSYLQNNNNYFKLCAYRKNFPKHPAGKRCGEYIGLDFAALIELSVLDMRMRYIFMSMALDVEHFAKVQLLKEIELREGNGYQIIEDYFSTIQCKDRQNHGKSHERLIADIRRQEDNPYCGGIIKKYDGCYPVWAFLEIISFGTFIDFYRFSGSHLMDKEISDKYYLLRTIKDLRNAAAHSNCLIHDMGAKDSRFRPDYGMLRALNKISKAVKDNQLKNERMRQMVTLLYAHTVFVNSPGVRRHTGEKLQLLTTRLFRHREFYRSGNNILEGFSFFKAAVDNLC